MFKLKRIYAGFDESDGYRVLVDRLWPRGVSKEKAHIDLWMKQIAPSDKLRKWFGHDPKRWPEFQRRYADEFRQQAELAKQLKLFEKEHGTVTLVFSARDEERNQAVALRQFLEK